MRTYGQYCSLAKALDLLGDRWTLLIIRELYLRGPSRYTDLRAGLPGIATNLLADRLRELEAAGVVAREQAAPPIATTLFSLTPRGEELKEPLLALGRWGIPLMAAGPAPGDEFRNRWMALPTELFLRDHDPAAPPVAIEVRTGEEPMLIETVEGEGRLRPGSTDRPDAVLSGTPHLVLAVLTGGLELAEAEALGLRCEGSRASVMRVLPTADGGPVRVAATA
ncbi:MAG: helix-turn-helix transcriptional regulator [Actinobacteria bacterium]|nr:MAG: helix-turn-helix transcriptional regulator [Actinomycetota bacterium]